MEKEQQGNGESKYEMGDKDRSKMKPTKEGQSELAG